MRSSLQYASQPSLRPRGRISDLLLVLLVLLALLVAIFAPFCAQITAYQGLYMPLYSAWCHAYVIYIYNICMCNVDRPPPTPPAPPTHTHATPPLMQRNTTAFLVCELEDAENTQHNFPPSYNSFHCPQTSPKKWRKHMLHVARKSRTQKVRQSWKSQPSSR